MINGGNNRKFTPILKKIISAKLSGINHPNYGKQLKEETKQKLSIALTGIKNPNFGKSFSDETKNKLREKALNRFCSDITANKISESLKKFYKDDSKKIKNNIFVQQYDFKNNLINTFYSLSEAARCMGVSSNSIIRASDPKMVKYKTCKGYIWKRVENFVL